MTYEVWRIDLDDMYTSYTVCVDKKDVEKFLKSLENATNVIDYGYLYDTEDVCECSSVYDPESGDEIPASYYGCENWEEEEDWE